jgi:hypothetical protein
MLSSQLIVFGLLALIVTYLLIMVRHEKLDFVFLPIWLGGFFLTSTLIFMPSIWVSIAESFGFIEPSNLFFVICIFFLAMMALQQSVAITKLTKDVEKIAQLQAIESAKGELT